MRTTIQLPEALVEAAKERARAEGRTFASLVEEGLRMVLSAAPSNAAYLPLPVSQVHRRRMLTDLDDKDALWQALDADGCK